MKAVLQFLTQLKKNNTREWMMDNKPKFESAKQEFQHLVANLIMGIGSFDESVLGVTPKESIFRVNRDVRFSKDKSPYKTNFGAAICQGGRKSPKPMYYIHMEPDNCFLGGGIYMPASEMIKKIRQEIDYNPNELLNVIANKEFKKTFGELEGEKLKTAPRGYSTDHPQIGLLQLKSFLAVRKLPDTLFSSDTKIDDLSAFFHLIKPLNDYLSVATE